MTYSQINPTKVRGFLLLMGLILLVGCSIYVPDTSLEKVCNQDIDAEYDYIYFNLSSTASMYPTINKTSIAHIEKVNNDTKLQIGDIVLFRVPKSLGCFWVHRIIDIKSDSRGAYYVTKGDNNWFNDFFQKTRRKDISYKIIEIE